MEKDLKKIVGKELMLLRKDKGLTMMELAKKAKLATSTITRYENGKHNMNLDVIEKILHVCETEPYIFFNNCVAKLQ